MVESTRSSNGRRAPARVLLPIFLSAAGAGAAATLILLGHPAWAGVAVLAGAAGLMWEARGGGASAPRAVFAGRLLDPVFDAAILAPIAWAWRQADPLVSALALIGLGLSLVASYERVKAGSLGYATGRGGVAHGLRAAVVGAGLVTAALAAGLGAFVVLVAGAVVVATLNVAKQERGGAE
jgi:hypothetical protein